MQVCISSRTTTPTTHHSVFLQARCPSCRPTNSVKALKERGYIWKQYLKKQSNFSPSCQWCTASVAMPLVYSALSALTLLVGTQTHNHASISRRNRAYSWILKMWTLNILLAMAVQRDEMHHQIWSNSCRDIAIFIFFFKMAAVRHLGFGAYRI